MYIYVYTYVYIYIHTYAHTHRNVHMHIYKYIYVCEYIYAPADTSNTYTWAITSVLAQAFVLNTPHLYTSLPLRTLHVQSMSVMRMRCTHILSAHTYSLHVSCTCPAHAMHTHTGTWQRGVRRDKSGWRHLFCTKGSEFSVKSNTVPLWWRPDRLLPSHTYPPHPHQRTTIHPTRVACFWLHCAEWCVGMWNVAGARCDRPTDIKATADGPHAPCLGPCRPVTSKHLSEDTNLFFNVYRYT